ncbi:carbonate dehydratase [Azospira restricta]|uniref:Carbonic anhydrase 2 n=1 Tax=Azospira restricta TaxID=404405 RepID=A0A974SQ97_9RHOO|nr:carbonate dehydratase [Azospira restricta]QRJ64404.1 carbonate dehydratase [Azospira restricta]
MSDLQHLFEKNRAWSESIRQDDPDFFQRLSRLQAPEYLWIGCSDSRVPANQIAGLLPGEVFVHRNVANQVVHSDLNCLSVLQYGVDALRVKHVLVVGHYGCGGVKAAHQNLRLGLVDNWLRHIQDVKQKHAAKLAGIGDEKALIDRLCELNVIEQVLNVCQTTVVQEAWNRGQALTIHGWIFGLTDGLVRDLGISIESPANVQATYEKALAALETVA